jgi:hypothetical protein
MAAEAEENLTGLIVDCKSKCLKDQNEIKTI